MKRVLFIGSLLLASGCTTAKSNYHFSRGTVKLQDGHYDEAIAHLEKAIEFDPSMSRNQNNLAAAYWGTGQIEKAWVHSRKAIRADLENRYAAELFLILYDEMSQNLDVEREGFSELDLINALGVPDEVVHGSDYGSKALVFGVVSFEFEGEKLKEFRWLPPFSHRNF